MQCSVSVASYVFTAQNSSVASGYTYPRFDQGLTELLHAWGCCRFPVLLNPAEKEISRTVCLAFGQKVREACFDTVNGLFSKPSSCMGAVCQVACR
jgi:hypothetical protein